MLKERLIKHINYGRLEMLIYDWIEATLPTIPTETEEQRQARCLTCIAYIENEIIEVGADAGLLLIFEFTNWYLDADPIFIPKEKQDKERDKYKNVFVSEFGTLIFNS